MFSFFEQVYAHFDLIYFRFNLNSLAFKIWIHLIHLTTSHLNITVSPQFFFNNLTIRLISLNDEFIHCDYNLLVCSFSVEASVVPDLQVRELVEKPLLVSSKDDEFQGRERAIPFRQQGRIQVVTTLTTTVTTTSSATTFVFIPTTSTKTIVLGTSLSCLPAGLVVCK